MFNIGGGELLVIALIALIVLGPQRLPDAARQVGKTMGDLRRLSSGFQTELRSAIDEADRSKTAASDGAGTEVPAAVHAVSAQAAPKKAPARKPAAKKAAANKTSAKKPAANKTSAKKPAKAVSTPARRRTAR